MKLISKLLAVTAIVSATSASATDLEVMHWWTSGGEAAAVQQFADAFNKTDHTWVDAAIAGGEAARAVMVSRLTGGDPMGAFQFNHGRQAEELIEAGLLRDITDIAEAEGWTDTVYPPSLLEACTVNGRIYCAPVNIHSWQWIWLSHKAYEEAGVSVPKNWTEFVATAPKLEAAGKVPLALGQQGWQQRGLVNVLFAALASEDLFMSVFKDKNTEAAASAEVTEIFNAADTARTLAAKSTVQNWNDATNLVITGKAGGQIMGDWAQGEFQVAEQVAGKDYTCLPGLGVNEVIQTGGDAFYFPKVDDEAITKAQGELAKVMISPETQVAFNLKKGSLPVRGDVDLSAANDCMRKGLDILAKGNIIPGTDQLMSADSNQQVNDLFVEFFNNPEMSAEDAQAQFASIISSAD